MIEPLPDSLRALIEIERDAPVGGDRGAIRARVLASVGIATTVAAASAASASTASTTTLGIGGKLVALALVAGIGGGVALLARDRDDDEPRADSAIVASESSPVRRETPPQFAPRVDGPRIENAAPATRDPAPVPRASKPSRTTAPNIHASRRDEPHAVEPAKPVVDDHAAILHRAWQAHLRGDHAAVLALVERDANEHPTGTLVEEREALRVDSLRRVGRTTEARTRARAFTARFPTSLHRALVMPALEESP